MATFRKRGDKWQARVQHRGQPDLAKSFALKVDAEAWARQIESEIDRGAYLDRTEAERTTLGDLLGRCLKETTTAVKPSRPLPPDSNQMASAIPGAIQGVQFPKTTKGN